MAAADHGLTAKLVQLTEHYVSLHLHENAVFMAERLVAVAPSEANRHLLGTVLFTAGRVARTCAVLRGCRSPANVYLLARACIAIGRFAEAESALLEAAGLVGTDVDAQVLALQSRPYLLPNGAAGAFLLGWACHRAGRHDAASKYYLLCLFLDPFNFAAYESLCKLGFYPHPAQAFSAARLTPAGGYAERPAAPAAPLPFGPYASSRAAEDAAWMQQQPVAVPSPLLSPITPAAKLLLLHSPAAAAAATTAGAAGADVPASAAAVPPPHPPPPPSAAVLPPLRPAAAAATPMPARFAAGRGDAAHTESFRAPPPSSALRAHPALAASLAAGVGSADRFGYYSGGATDAGAASTGFVASPVPLELQNDGTALWSRVLGMSMAPPSASTAPGGGLFALRSGTAGGEPRTDDFLRRHPSTAGVTEAETAASVRTSAFGTPAAAAGARGQRFSRRAGGGGLPRSAAVSSIDSRSSAVGGGGASSVVRPFLLPPGSAATAAPATAPQQRPRQQEEPPPPSVSGGALDDDDFTMLHLPGAGHGGGGAADFTGVSAIAPGEASAMGDADGGYASATDWAGATPSGPGDTTAAAGIGGGALFVPGPAGIIMAGKRKARAADAPHWTAGSAAESTAAAAAPATVVRAAASSSAAEAQPPPSAVASTAVRPKSKRLSFSGVPGSGSSAAEAPPLPQQSPSTRARGGGGGGAGAAVQSPLRRLRSHSEVMLSSTGGAAESHSSTQAGSRGSPAHAAAAKSAASKPLLRAMSARQVAAGGAPTFRGTDDRVKASSAGPDGAGHHAIAVPHSAGTPAASAAAPPSVAPAAAPAPRAPSVEAVLARGAHELLSLLRLMAFVVSHAEKFECEAALQTLAQLPRAEAESPWALGMRGRARFELGQHAEARVAFKLMREKAPHRLDYLDLYSTVLWHLKAAPELAALSDELITVQPGSSVAWVVAANRFALAKDHKRAVSALQRALQLDPFNAYAHTLLGHERSALGQLDEAVTHFQRATALERHQYNAWYGLGTAYFKNKQLDLAELHYRRACVIHKHSPTLLCYLGMVLAANKRTESALEALERASLLDPGNPQAEYQKALVLLADDRRAGEARAALLKVLTAAPGEPAVLMQLGKACKRLGLLEEAAVHLNAALACSRANDKQANRIKGMLQSLAATGDDGDVVF